MPKLPIFNDFFSRIAAIAALVVLLTALLGGCAWPFFKHTQTDLIICVPGSLKPLIERFSAIYESQNSDSRFIIKDVSSRYALQMVADKSVDAALTYYNNDSSFGLLSRQVGVMPYVFFVNSTIGVKNLTSAQIAGILSEKITNWREICGTDEEIVVLHPNYNTALPQAVRAQFLNNAQFPGLPLHSDESADLPERVERTHGAIAYQDVIALDKMYGNNYSIEIVSIDGVLPYHENLQNGKYQAVLPINLIYSRNTPGNEKMIEFLIGKLTESDFFLRNRIK
ncbi:MAG: substrate-binding domain-containing protein [Bacillota bacterium]